MQYSIQFQGFNSNNQYQQYMYTINDNTYIFTVRWSPYCDCAFLSIADYGNNPIVTGVALVNGLKIRHHDLPYEFYFVQINNETYEPTIDNIATEFALIYEDGE